jgi:nucleoside-diphosphate-sugar epimerase
MPNMEILVTGTDGFSGSHPAKTLKKQEHVSVGVDNLSP